jgi:hypothetical protein
VVKKPVAKKPVPKKPVSGKPVSSTLISKKTVSSKPVSGMPLVGLPGVGKRVSKKSVSGQSASKKLASSSAGSSNAGPSKKSSEKTVPVNPNPIAAHMNLTVLEVADPSDLNVLLADPRIGMLIAARLSDSSAIVTPDKTEALLKALKDGGHTPKIVRPEFRDQA